MMSCVDGSSRFFSRFMVPDTDILLYRIFMKCDFGFQLYAPAVCSLKT